MPVHTNLVVRACPFAAMGTAFPTCVIGTLVTEHLSAEHVKLVGLKPFAALIAKRVPECVSASGTAELSVKLEQLYGIALLAATYGADTGVDVMLVHNIYLHV